MSCCGGFQELGGSSTELLVCNLLHDVDQAKGSAAEHPAEQCFRP